MDSSDIAYDLRDAQEGNRQELAAAYRVSRSFGRSCQQGVEETDAEVVRLGSELCSQVTADYRGRHRDSGVRAFSVFPWPPQRNLSLGDHLAALVHLGIPCTWALPDDPLLAVKLEVFRPTLIFGAETPDYLASGAPSAVAAYKRAHGCIRLFNPPRPARNEDGELDQDGRRSLTRDLAGDIADGHIWTFLREYYAHTLPEWSAADFPYFELTAAVNPRLHFPLPGVHDFDYFMVSSPDPRRPATAVEYLAPIMRRSYGLWAGPGWGFGEGRIAAADTPRYYARTRVAPNPLHPHLTERAADLTHRTFAAIACGAFVITSRTPATARFFTDDELVSVDGPGAFGAAFDHFVGRPRERNAIVARGLRRVFAEHTTFHRGDRLVRFLRDHADLA